MLTLGWISFYLCNAMVRAILQQIVRRVIFITVVGGLWLSVYKNNVFDIKK
jgi:hypothetical protein